jgi:hypothetical protein
MLVQTKMLSLSASPITFLNADALSVSKLMKDNKDVQAQLFLCYADMLM